MVELEDLVECIQVELNTISSSFGCLCTLVGQLHHYIMEHQGASEQVLILLNINVPCFSASVAAVPVNAFSAWTMQTTV